MAFDPDKYLAKKSTGFDPDAYLAKTAPAQATAQPVQTDTQPVKQDAVGQESGIDALRRKITENPAGATLAEFGSAVNRGVVNLLDFFGPDAINAALELAGTDARIPTFGQAGEATGATQGEFMEPGLARQAVRTSGEMVGPGAAFGQAFRVASKAVPAVQSGAQTLGQRVTQQLGQSKPMQDVTGAALSGAGMETGGEIGEAIGGETGKQVGKLTGAIALPISATIIKETAKSLATTSAKKLLQETAPTIQGLKEAARKVYGEIDDLGAVVNSSRITRLGNELESIAKKEGFNKRIHPKVSAALDEFNSVKGTDQSVSNLDTLRKIAQSAARSTEPDEQRLGSIIINKIDDFMDDLKPEDFSKGAGNIGSKYKDARQLWHRAKKAEMIEDAMTKAKDQASGFENGIRIQFRQILNNKKKVRGFNQDEIDAMRKVVQGGTLENTAKLIGKLGFSEAQATNMLMGSLGVAGGAAAFGAPGAVAVPVIGQVSRNLAQKLTRNNAEAANTIVRAGKDADKLVRAYIKAIPKQDRNPAELAELLLRPGVNAKQLESRINMIPKEHRKLISDAVFIAGFTQQEEDE